MPSVTAAATLRPTTSGWRAGADDHQQHRAADRHQALCGAPIKGDQRYDRPDYPKCLECSSWTESELREAFG